MPHRLTKRERLVNAADLLFREKGYYTTTLNNIAEKADVPLGNVYYYFKTKKDICSAVVDKRKRRIIGMLERSASNGNPKESLIKLLKTIGYDSDELARIGCPVARLCREIGDELPDIKATANECMEIIIGWIADRFAGMGVKQPEKVAFDMVAKMQGIVLLGGVRKDPLLIKEGFTRIINRIASISSQNTEQRLVI